MALQRVLFLSKPLVNGIFKVLSYFLPQYSRTTTDADEYIQQSSLPTMYFQDSLPRLPIPKLKDSCEKYLKAQEPILSPEEFAETSKNVKEFLEKEGPVLHAKLLEIDDNIKHTSYISEPWFDMYLRDRKPLPINYNPYMVFYQNKNERYNIPLVKATNMVLSSARFIKTLRAERLEPEVFHMNKKKSDTKLFRFFTGLLPSKFATYGAYLFKAFPLDMSQFKHLFGTSRIPEMEKDRIYNDPSARHVLVMRRGYFYTFDIINEDGRIRSAYETASCLNSILNDSRASNPYPIGVLTTTERNQWASNRQHLVNLDNERVFKRIDSAAFLLALDDDLMDGDVNVVLKNFLHSDGSNRWFDKSFTLIVTGKGWTGINFEHSWGDGIAVLRFCDNIINDVNKQPRFHPDDQADLPLSCTEVEKLEFKIDDVIKKTVNIASTEYDHWTQDRLSVDYILCDTFNKKMCKNAGVSPDAIMQLSFQLGLYKLEKRAVATYESCSTAAFKHGRTETIRSCTNETTALCKNIVENGMSQDNARKYKKLLIECSKAHAALTKEAAMGQGFDRHLFMLRRISMENDSLGKNTPAMFKDPAFHKLNCNILSTSTLSTSIIMGGGFGPTAEQGYGIGYILDDTDIPIRLGVASYKENRDASEYVQALRSAFQDIREILLSN
ncbi:carnitine O-palmitoyltransferase 2, mitochondrial [Fopius arisanus]|uniref:Carnitine O-palmitoyltransferase 2, mitochondrial n=1 Tax=Fopius arisanus TaxID=64838 RepID=A0A9R1U640_9HYME|nr:PREDICTED: carnitine O-palmitoyltransferase 2, mitochondrial [Fopius arisanus]